MNPPASTLAPEGPIRTVGAGKEPTMTFHASSEAFDRGTRFVDALCRLGNQAVAFKGVRYFKTHEEANEDWENGLARCMAAWAARRAEQAPAPKSLWARWLAFLRS